jgi:hypothetical protein
MAPFPHHSFHEILWSARTWGIKYDVTLNEYDLLIALLNNVDP